MSRNALFDTPTLRRQIGARLKSERARLKLKRHRFWELTQYVPETLGSYELGLARVPSSFLAACAFIGMDVQFVLTGVRSSNAAEASAAIRPARAVLGSAGLPEDHHTPSTPVNPRLNRAGSAFAGPTFPADPLLLAPIRGLDPAERSS